MRQYGLLLLSVLALFGLCGLATAGEKEELKALVEQAIKARGGEARLKKLQAAAWQSEGNFFGRTSRATLHGQLPGKFRLQSERTEKGRTTLFVKIINGDRGWTVEGGKARPMSREELTQTRDTFYHKQMDATVLPLRDKEVQLKLLGESRVDGRPVVGVKVGHKGYPDIRMYFDKKTKLLVKSEREVKDRKTGKAVLHELHYSDYRDHDGVKIAHRTRRVIGGKSAGNVRITEFKPQKYLDPSLFLPVQQNKP